MRRGGGATWPPHHEDDRRRDEPAPTPPTGGVVERDLPEPARLRRLIGPSVILVGVGVASGEYILFPYIASKARARVPVGRSRRRRDAVLHQHGDRALHARDRADGDHRLLAAVEAVGPDPRAAGAARHRVAGLGDERRDRRDVRVRRRRPDDDRRRSRCSPSASPSPLAGRLPDRRAARVPQGRRDPRVHRRSRCSPRSRATATATRRRRSRSSAPSRARSSWRSSSARWPRPAPAAPTTSCRATGSATRASAWAATRRASSPRSPARRRPRPRASATASPRTRRTWPAGACGGGARTSSSSSPSA